MKQLPLPFPPDTVDFVIKQDGKFAGTYTVTIDYQDRDLLKYKWRVMKSNGKNPYAYGRIGRRQMALHRFILERKLEMTFQIGDLQWSDHCDMNTLNNTRDNLRIVTPSQNAMNTRLNPNNTSGYRGVCKGNNKWIAAIYVDGKRKHLGTFETKEEARDAYEIALQEYYGEHTKAA